MKEKPGNCSRIIVHVSFASTAPSPVTGEAPPVKNCIVRGFMNQLACAMTSNGSEARPEAHWKGFIVHCAGPSRSPIH